MFFCTKQWGATMNIELERLADLLAKLIEKYAEKIDWANLPDPPPKPGKKKPATDKEVAGFFCFAGKY